MVREETFTIKERRTKGKDLSSLSDWFWKNVDTQGPNDCWLWKSYRYPNGYGHLKGLGRDLLAHRVSWELTNGPTALNVLHSCDNRLCVNPAHLFTGTQRDNLNDMRRKSRGKNASGFFATKHRKELLRNEESVGT